MGLHDWTSNICGVHSGAEAEAQLQLYQTARDHTYAKDAPY